MPNIYEIHNKLKEYYPKLEWNLDKDFNVTTIETETDIGHLSIMYEEGWYVSLEDEQFGEAKYPENIEELLIVINKMINC